MKLVKFENGKYGIRMYWRFGWHFLSMSGEYTWSSKKDIVSYCQGTEEQARMAMQVFNCKYTVVK